MEADCVPTYNIQLVSFEDSLRFLLEAVHEDLRKDELILKETTFQLGDAKSETKKDAALKMLEEAAQKLIHIQKRPLRP